MLCECKRIASVVIILFCQFISSFVVHIGVSIPLSMCGILCLSPGSVFFFAVLFVRCICRLFLHHISHFGSIIFLGGKLLWNIHVFHKFVTCIVSGHWNTKGFSAFSSCCCCCFFLSIHCLNSKSIYKYTNLLVHTFFVLRFGVDIVVVNRMKCCCWNSMNESRHHSHMLIAWVFF